VEHLRQEWTGAEIIPKDRERPQLRYLRRLYEIPEVIGMVERELGHRNRFAKALAVFVCRDTLDLPLDELTCHFEMSLSGIYSARRRIRKEIDRNLSLARSFGRIIEELGYGTPQRLEKSNEK
jgi:hypothetical protein